MTTKEWLNRARKLDFEIAALEDARSRALERCLSVTAKFRDVPVSGGGSDQDGKFAAYANLSGEIDRMVDELCSIKSGILAAIKKVEDSTLRTLLIERYINCKTWEQIAEDMSFTYRWVLHLHDVALQAIKVDIVIHI